MFSRILNWLEDIYTSVEQFQKILQMLKKLWKVIEYIIFIAYLFIFALQFTSIRNWILNLKEEKGYKVFIEFIYENTNWSLFILLSILIVAFIYKIWKLGKMGVSQYEEQEAFLSQLHSRFIHDIRDNIKELERDANILSLGNEDVMAIARENMFQTLSNNIQNYVDFIAEILSKYCKTTISVCVKIVKIENNDTNNPLAVTLARSSNTRKERLKEDETIGINQNDDFKYLYNGSNTFYGKADLVQEHKEGNYHVTDSIEVWSSKYKSTLVAPIRYYSKHSKHNNVNLDFDILGFLCIDANQIMKQWEDINSYELKVLAIFADAMYIYLKKYKEAYCDKK